MDRDAHRKPHHHRLCARLPHGCGDRRRPQTARSPRSSLDHAPITARSTPRPIPRKYPAGMFGIVTGSYDFPRRLPRSTRTSPTRRPAASPIAALSASPKHLRDRARHGYSGATNCSMDAVELRKKNFIRRAVPVSVAAGVHLRQRRLSQTLRSRRSRRSATTRC